MDRDTTTKTLIVLGGLVLTIVALLGTAPTAEAQISCADQSLGWEVSTAAEFNAAVDCHNASPDASTSNIILLADITADTTAGGAVFTPISGGTLIIVGEGHTLRRASGAPDDAVPVLKFETSTSTLLGAIDLAIEVGPYDTAGIEHLGPSWLRLVTTSISPGPAGSEATGVISSPFTALSDGGFILVASSIEGLPVGLSTTRAAFGLEASTIASTGVDITAGGNPGQSGRVINSTLGGPVGIRMDGGNVVVENSTILGDGAAASATTPPESHVNFRSSIVNTCSADMVDVNALPPAAGWSSGGFNVGSCFDNAAPLPLTLADNGCSRRTPLGCPRTAALDFPSPALDAGRCVAGEPYEGDQRGFPRQPQDVGCDAGAFESGCTLNGLGDVEVATPVEFNQALVCHNFGGTASTIVLLDDIVAQTVSNAAVFPPIELGELTVQGNGHSLSRATSAGTTDAPLVAVAADVEGAIKIYELGLELGLHDTYGIDHAGNDDLFFEDGLIVAPSGSAATGIRSAPASSAQTLIQRSTIEGLRIGAEVTSGYSNVLSSTLASSEIDLLSHSDGSFAVVSSTLTAPVGLRIGDGSRVFVSNSTVLGDGASAAPDSTGAVSYVSSIVNDCTTDVQPPPFFGNPGVLPAVYDDGGNVGGCFKPGQLTDTVLADNGCVSPGPFGCTKTVALSTNSAALSAGDCSDEFFPNMPDQRGTPRTPAEHAGCDAGAFEFAPCAVADPFRVDSAGKFVAAISCFNQGAFGPGDYTIELLTDIEVDTAGQRTTITQPTAGYSLTIQGNGHTIKFDESTRLPTVTYGVVSIGITSGGPVTNAAPVTIENTVITRDQSAGSDAFWALGNASSATLTVSDSVMRTDGGFSSVVSLGGGDLIIDASIIEAVRSSENEAFASTSVYMQDGGTLHMADSTVVNLRPEAPGAAVDIRSGSVDITNSTFDDVALVTDVDVTGTVSNSTFNGRGIPGIGDLLITSSIVNECDPIVTDGGGNVGSCFGSQVDLDDAADNGCAIATPEGCPKTFALATNSPARGAGDCTDMPTDQRGEPRTPAGPGCDAGSFEATASMLGDVDASGTVTNADVQALLVWLAGGPEPVDLAAGEVTANTVINLADALAIAQQVAGG